MTRTAAEELRVSKTKRMTNADEKKRVGVHTCRVHTDIRYRTPGTDGSYIHSRIRVMTRTQCRYTVKKFPLSSVQRLE